MSEHDNEEIFSVKEEEGCVVLTSKRIKTSELSQIELARMFFEQLASGNTGIIYNLETRKLEDRKK